MSDAILAELRALRALCERIAEDVETALNGRRLSRDERALLGVLLPQLAAIVRDSAFTAADAFTLPQLAPLLVGLTVRTLPRLLVRAEGVTFAVEYRAVRVGRCAAGALFVVTKMARDRHTPL
jgi:hypothetical protein